jgi:hypothetical protein
MDDMDMDNSMLSVASLPDFAAATTASGGGLAGSGCSDDTSAAEMSLTSEAILDIVRPAAAAVEAFHSLEDEDECSSSSLRFEGLTLASGMSQGLDCVDQPTLVADITNISQRTLAADTHTLVAAAAPEGATYCVVPAPAAGGAPVADNAGDDTIADVTDICDEESVMEPTLATTDSDAGLEDIPELPRDLSQQATPAASGGESSVETTPLAGRRKLSPREKRQQDPERFLTFTKKERPDSASVSSGYKSEETAMAVPAVPQRRDSASSSSSASSRTQQRRLEDADRFRTRTISREDIGNIPGNFDIVVVPPPTSSNNAATQQSTAAATTAASPRGSIRQRRTEEADRYRTHTVSVGDLPPLSPSRISAVAADMRISPAAGLRITASEAAFLESEARLVVQTIKERKAEARSRSTSVDLLKEPERRRSTFILSRVTYQCFGSIPLIPDPDPAFSAEYQSGSGSRVLVTKNWKNNYSWEKINIILFKNCPSY